MPSACTDRKEIEFIHRIPFNETKELNAIRAVIIELSKEAVRTDSTERLFHMSCVLL